MPTEPGDREPTLEQRLGALTMSMELSWRERRDSERQFNEQFAKHEQLFGEIALRFRDTRETIDGLARIAGVHQERLDDHGERIEGLEREQ